MISDFRFQISELRYCLSNITRGFFLLILSFLFLAFASFTICRYTVREIAYSSIGSEPYKLNLIIDNSVSEGFISAFQSISYAAFLESNIEAEIVNISKNENFYKENNLSEDSLSIPAVLFQNPDGRFINPGFILDDENFNENVWNICEEVTNSLTRNLLLEELSSAFGVILFFEGSDKDINIIAKEEIKNAHKDFLEISGMLAKPMDRPPVLLNVPFQERVSEKILLWSLGLNKISGNEPAVAVLYGRGRIMGPVLTEEKIKSNSIYNLLSIIGADCECGLDQSWMLGKMIPLVWDKNTRDIVTTKLGFDVDNPLIMSEISQILSISFRNREVEEIFPDLLKNNILEIEREKRLDNNNKKKTGFFNLIEEKPIAEKIAFVVSLVFTFSIIIVVIFIIRKRRNR